MPFEHWKHYLALEADLNTIARYVEPADGNIGTFSVELTKLFLSAASEAEVVCRVLCAEHKLSVRTNNIDGWREALHARFPKLHTIPVIAHKYGLKCLPWSDWATGANPQWWRDHNDVKHERHAYFAKASLGNSLDSMAGLCVLLWYLYPQVESREDAFFEHGGEASRIVTHASKPPDL